MGLGALLTRNLQYVATNTQTGATDTYTIITDGGPGMYADWQTGEYRGGMGVPAAWRLANLVANQIGRMPWHAFRERGGGPAEKLVPQPPLLAYPVASDEAGLEAWRSMALDRLWHGNAVALIASRSPLGWPTGIALVDAESARVHRFGAAITGYDMPPPGFSEGEIGYWIGGRWYHRYEVIHWRGPTRPGQLRGMGILENHFEALSRAKALDSAASAVSSAGVPTGLLESLNPDLTKVEAEELKTSWTTAQRTRSVAVLNPSTRFTPIAWNPTETQLLESRQYSLIDWANIFGLPVTYANGQNASRVYANIVDQGHELLRYGAVGDLVAEFEGLMTAQFPRGTYVKGNQDHLLRPDTKGRYEAHAIAIAAGFMSPDEVRELEEREPLTKEQQAQILAAKATPALAGGAPAAASSSSGSSTSPPRLAAARSILDGFAALEPGSGEELLFAHPADMEERAWLDEAELKAWSEDVRAADLDGSNLKEYWTAGPGLAKWSATPTPWRTLRRFLSKYISGAQLDATTSAWYRLVFGALPHQRSSG